MPEHMSEISLEDFSADRRMAVRQAIKVSRLVASQKKWLKEVQPGTVERYLRPHKARPTILNFASINAYHPYIVKRDFVAIGLATIIFGQNIIHPSEGTFEGTDIDYWIEEDEQAATHIKVASQLLSKHVQLSAVLKSEKPPQAIATIVSHHPNPPVGIVETMTAIGEPAVMDTSVIGDPYGITRDGKPAQLYVADHA